MMKKAGSIPFIPRIIAAAVIGSALVFGACSCQAVALGAIIATDYQGEKMECPYCQEQIPANEYSCPNCGAALK